VSAFVGSFSPIEAERKFERLNMFGSNGNS
jgi:hypothetical protein